MKQTFQQILSLLTHKQRNGLWKVVLGVVVVGLLEVIGVASILPFMQLIAEPTVITEHPRVGPIITSLGYNDQRSIIIFSGCCVIGLILLSSIVTIGVKWLKQSKGWLFAHQISTRLLRVYLQKPYAYFLNVPSNEMVVLLVSEVNAYMTGVLLPSVDLVSKCFSSIVIFGLLFYVSPIISGTMLVILGGIYAIIFILQRKKLAKLGRQRSKLNIQRFKHMGEVFDGIKTVHAYNRQAFFYDYFERASQAYSKIQPTYQIMTAAPRHLLDVMAFGTIVGITLLLYLNGNDLVQALPILSLFAVAGYRLLPALQGIFSALGSIRHNFVSIEKLQPLIDVANGQVNELASHIEVEKQPFEESLVLENLFFAYENSDEEVLKNLNITIPKGHTVAFVGTTGSGKTTLVDVIMGLLLPQRGSISIDKVKLDEENQKQWRALTAYVPQDIFLFNDTIANNICMTISEEEIDKERLKDVIKTASLDVFINSLPDGLDTTVGPKGSRLSGGQRQRLGLARALYAEPEVLVLDEATSALDNVTEKNIVNALNKLDRQITTIIIAHRLSSVKRADQIYVLEKGEIVEQGTYDSLIKQESVFHRMSTAPNQLN